MNQSYSHFITESGLPFEILGGIETLNQAQFHPRKYMLGLAKCIEKNGGQIFTNSVVNDVKSDENGFMQKCIASFRIHKKVLIQSIVLMIFATILLIIAAPIEAYFSVPFSEFIMGV